MCGSSPIVPRLLQACSDVVLILFSGTPVQFRPLTDINKPGSFGDLPALYIAHVTCGNRYHVQRAQIYRRASTRLHRSALSNQLKSKYNDIKYHHPLGRVIISP